MEGNRNILVSQENEDPASSLASRIPQHPVLSNTIFQTRSRDSDYSALDFLCDMCLEVQNSPTILSTPSFEKFAESHANSNITETGSFEKIEQDTDMTLSADNVISDGDNHTRSLSKTCGLDPSKLHQFKPQLPSPLAASNPKNKDVEYSKLDFLCDTCFEVEANQIVSNESLERFAQEMDFNLSADFGSNDEESIFSPKFGSGLTPVGQNNTSNKPKVFFGSKSSDPLQEQGEAINQLNNTNSNLSHSDNGQIMKVNVRGVDMSVRVVHIGNSCYLQPVSDSSLQQLSHLSSYQSTQPPLAALAPQSTSKRPPSIIPQSSSLDHTHHTSDKHRERERERDRESDSDRDGQLPSNRILSRSQNANANAAEVSVDRLSKLMRMNSISPRDDSRFNFMVKHELGDRERGMYPPAHVAVARTPSLPSDRTASLQQYIDICTPQMTMESASLRTMGDYQPQIGFTPPQSALPSHPYPVLPHEMPQPKPEPPTRYITPSVPPTVVPPEGTPLLPPKHIYRTACETYRVQVGKGVKGNPNGKFSRNVRNETDAIWLCEIALLFIDCPPTLKEMLCNGNYKCLLQRNAVLNPMDYLSKLTSQTEQMRARGFLKDPEWHRATTALVDILASTQKVAQNSVNDSQNSFPGDFIDLTPNMSPMDLAATISSRKKRRRHNVGDRPPVNTNISTVNTSTKPDKSVPHSSVILGVSPLNDPVASPSVNVV